MEIHLSKLNRGRVLVFIAESPKQLIFLLIQKFISEKNLMVSLVIRRECFRILELVQGIMLHSRWYDETKLIQLSHHLERHFEKQKPKICYQF